MGEIHPKEVIPIAENKDIKSGYRGAQILTIASDLAKGGGRRQLRKLPRPSTKPGIKR